MNIKVIISQDDANPANRIVCKAAQASGAKFIVVSHGYIQDPYLISICPIEANMFLTWTDSQMRDIKSVANNKSKIKCIGFPKHIGKSVSDRNWKNQILFASEPLVDRLTKSNYRTHIKSIIDHILREDYNVLFRLHPKERDNQQVISFIKDQGADISSNSLLEDVESSRLVLGSNTSVLVESSYLSRATYQVEELARYNFESVNKVSIDDLPGLMLTCDHPLNSTPLTMPVDKMSQHVENLLDSVVGNN